MIATYYTNSFKIESSSLTMTIQLVSNYCDRDGSDYGYVLATDSGGLILDNDLTKPPVPLMFVEKYFFDNAGIGIFSGIKIRTENEDPLLLLGHLRNLDGMFADVHDEKDYQNNPAFEKSPYGRLFVAQRMPAGTIDLFYLTRSPTSKEQSTTGFWATHGRARLIHRLPDRGNSVWYGADNIEGIKHFRNRRDISFNMMCDGFARILTDSSFSKAFFESMSLPNPFRGDGPATYDREMFEHFNLPLPTEGKSNQSIGPQVYVVGKNRFGRARVINPSGSYIVQPGAEWAVDSQPLGKDLLFE